MKKTTLIISLFITFIGYSQIGTNDADFYLNRGIKKAKKARAKDYRDAKLDFTKAIEIDPKNAKAYSKRGNVKAALGDKRGAISDYTKAIEIDPRHADAYNNRGITKYLLGDKDGGCFDFSIAEELGIEKASEMIQKFCN